MMRMQSGIIFALASAFAFVVACADSGTEEPDDMNEDDQQTQNVCGDGTCAASEVGYCDTDCGAGGNGGNNNATCGDGMCETTKGENGSSCASDCGGGTGTGSGGGGTSTTCPSDPLECFFCVIDASLCLTVDQATCNACLGGGGGGGGGFGDLLCEGGAPDGTCNAGAGEDTSTCPSDCQ